MKFLCVLFAVFALTYAKPGLLAKIEGEAPADTVHARHVAVVASAPVAYSATPVVYAAPYNHVIQSNEPLVRTVVSAPLVKTVSSPVVSAPLVRSVVSAPVVYSSPLVSFHYK